MSAQSRVDKVLENYSFAKRDKLIPILQDVQGEDGYISKHAALKVARHLNITASKVYGVATFYNQFRFKPVGRYHVLVCRGTACHVKGSAKALAMVTRVLKLQPGETSRDKLFSLEVVACMGACGLAPVVNINGQFYAKVSPLKLQRIIEACREKEQAHVHA